MNSVFSASWGMSQKRFDLRLKQMHWIGCRYQLAYAWLELGAFDAKVHRCNACIKQYARRQSRRQTPPTSEVGVKLFDEGVRH
jgi:hypothetical protein